VPGLEPRVPPLRDEAATPEQLEVLERVRPKGGNASNLFATVAKHPQLLRRWASFGNTLLRWGELPPIDREILVLRTTRNCGADYPWGQHDRAAEALGLSEEQRRQLAQDQPDVDEPTRLLLDVADELHRDAVVSDANWARLVERYSEAQLIELVFVVGQYRLVSMLANTLAIEPEAGLTPIPR
jgi:4-carboxymuconolactone decarboxylase